ncbi:MAG: hypothetical protein ACUVUD_02350, partial [bacterium]
MRHKVFIPVITFLFGLTGYLIGAGWSGSFEFLPQSFNVQQLSREGRIFTLLTPASNPQLNRYRLTVNYTQEIGKPLLPIYQFTLVIPQGMKVGAVNISTENVVTIPAENPPFPAQPPVPISERNLPKFVEPEPTVY